MGYIYLITNILTGKRYVGQTIRKDIETRWKEHRKCDKRSAGACLLKAYKKYGIEKFKFQLICICFDEDCNRYEEYYIKKFNTLAPNGYNLESGGNNSKCHPDTIKLLSELNKGDKNPAYGKKWTNEEREQKSLSIRGNKNPNYGVKSVHRKAVCKYDTELNFIEEFESIHEASIKTSIDERSISGVCNARKKTAGGFIWKFV